MSRIIALSLLAACGASVLEEKPGPRGLRADQHRTLAEREGERADEIAHWPDRQRAPEMTQTTWFGTWDTSAEHQRVAAVHRGQASALEAEYEQACGDTPAEIVTVSPLQRFGVGGSDIANGTLVLLSASAGPPDHLLAAMRCHRAWMMLGRTNMDDCPLDLPGLQVDAHGDANGIELSITIADPKLVPELRRRAAHDLEAANSFH